MISFRPVASLTRTPLVYVKWLLRHGLAIAFLKPLARKGDPLASIFFPPAAAGNTLPRAEASSGVLKSRSGYMVSGYSASRAVLSDSASFGVLSQMHLMPPRLFDLYRWSADRSYSDPFEYPSLVALEGGVHTELRRAIAGDFSNKRCMTLAPDIRVVAATHAASFWSLLDAPHSSADLVSNFSRPYALSVILIALGLDEGDSRPLLDYGEDVSRLLDLGTPLGAYLKLSKSAVRLENWASGLLSEGNFQAGSALARLAFMYKGGHKSDRSKALRTCLLLMTAGINTSVGLLTEGARLMITHPGALKNVRAGTASWESVVEEVLRFSSPVAVTTRRSVADGVLDGCPIRANRPVYLAGYNFDSDHFPDPHNFDPVRSNARTHLSFGGGAHVCVGASLARIEIRLGLQALLEERSELRLAMDPVPSSSILVRGWSRMDVRKASNC